MTKYDQNAGKARLFLKNNKTTENYLKYWMAVVLWLAPRPLPGGPDVESFTTEISLQVPTQAELRHKLSSLSSTCTDSASQDTEAGEEEEEDDEHNDEETAAATAEQGGGEGGGGGGGGGSEGGGGGGKRRRPPAVVTTLEEQQAAETEKSSSKDCGGGRPKV